MSERKNLADSETVRASGAAAASLGRPGVSADAEPTIASDESAPSPSREEPLPTPEVLADRYEVRALLGVGGMGAVYRAYDRELDEIVALKMLRSEWLGDASLLTRFRQEVKLARRVTHTNVARTFDIGEHAGRRFLTMEIVDGEPLAARIAREAPIPAKTVAELGLQICAGLAAAHGAGVIHRDLKPANVLVCSDGRAVITDFGVARTAGATTSALTQGLVVGTPVYMAPEQLLGAADLDARADIYALGAILYEMLVGRRAWVRDSAYAAAVARLSEPPPDPRSLNPKISDAMAELTLRCMASERDDRYASAEAVTQALVALRGLGTAGSTGGAHTPMTRPPHSIVPTKTVAVLPFRNRGAADDDYVADGFTDELIDSLSISDGVRVLSRGVVMQRKGDVRDPREIGRALGVQIVVEGWVEKTAGRLRVGARLLSVEDGFQLWAHRYDRESAAFVEVAGDCAAAVAGVLTTKYVPPHPPDVDPVAMDLYLRARHAYRQTWGDSLGVAVELLEQALAREPGNARFLTAYAMAQARRYFLTDAVDGLSLARQAAERALALVPSLGEAHVALAVCALQAGDGEAAARLTRSALAGTPDLLDARELRARILAEVGPPDDALTELEYVVALDPTSVPTVIALARAHAILGRSDAIEQLLRRQTPNLVSSPPYWLMLARLRAWSRDVEGARGDLERLALHPRAEFARMFFGAVLDPSEAQRARQLMEGMQADATSPRRRSYLHQVVAEGLAYEGKLDLALLRIEQACDSGFIDRNWLVHCPLFAPLRAEPRFAKIVETVSARAARVLAELV